MVALPVGRAVATAMAMGPRLVAVAAGQGVASMVADEAAVEEMPVTVERIGTRSQGRS